MRRLIRGARSSPGLGGRPGRAARAPRARARSPVAAGTRRTARSRASSARASARAQQLAAIRDAARPRARARTRAAVRRAAPDARRPAARRPRRRARRASERVNAEWAVQRAFDEVGALFADIDDPYLRERGGDVADVVGRAAHEPARAARAAGTTLLARRRRARSCSSPTIRRRRWPRSWTGRASRGLAIDAGSRTSHTAILARSLGIPTVVGLRDGDRARRRRDASWSLDGTTGELIVEPDRRRSTALRRRAADAGRPAAERAPAPPRAGDDARRRARSGSRPTSTASRTSAVARRAGAEGIGLFRSEFLLAATAAGPDRAGERATQQAEAYRR